MDSIRSREGSLRRSIVLMIDEEDREEFLEFFERAASGLDYSYRLDEKGRLVVDIFGDRSSQRTAEKKIRNAYRNFYIMKDRKMGLRRYPVEVIAELAAGVPIGLVERSIKLKGRKLERKKDILVTDLEPDEITDIINELRYSLDEIRPFIRQKMVREILVLASFISGVDVVDVMEKAIDLGLIEEVDGIYYLRKDPDEVVKLLIGGD
ncbi:MAG: hypothetical protein C0200_06010 [Thermoproteota archaeon]|nr:MAG: hypothetical protein C0200_06010 [Candidatus Korarchaeota archaeon]